MIRLVIGKSWTVSGQFKRSEGRFFFKDFYTSANTPQTVVSLFLTVFPSRLPVGNVSCKSSYFVVKEIKWCPIVLCCVQRYLAPLTQRQGCTSGPTLNEHLSLVARALHSAQFAPETGCNGFHEEEKCFQILLNLMQDLLACPDCSPV